MAYLKVLHSQLKQIPEDFFTSELTSNNFLLEPLGALFEVCYEELTTAVCSSCVYE